MRSFGGFGKEAHVKKAQVEEECIKSIEMERWVVAYENFAKEKTRLKKKTNKLSERDPLVRSF